VAAAAIAVFGPGVSWGDTTPEPLAGEGGSFPDPIMNLMLQDPTLVSAIAPFEPSYFDANIDVARQDFASGSNDFAVSELPLTSDEATTALQNGRSFAYVPFAASPVAIGAVVECSGTPFLTSATMCPGIKVTVPLLAQLFASTPSHGISWNSPALIALDPNLVDAQPASDSVQALEQVQPSVSNLALETLFDNDPTAKVSWDEYLQYYTQTTNYTPSELWPVTTGGVSGGDSGLAQDLVPEDEAAEPPLPLPDPQQWGQGEVAALGADWIGAPRNIPTVAIQNAAGDYVSPTVSAMQASLQDATMDPATNLVTFNTNPNDANAYPMPEMSYLIVPTSGLDSAKAQALAAMIRFILGTTGQAEVQSLGAAPVTPAMVTAGLKVADEVAAQSSGSTTTTTTTAPTTTTTTPKTTTTTTTKGSTSPSGQSTLTGESTSSDGGATTSTTSSGPSLALTGGVPWSLPLIGVTMAAVGYIARRALRSRAPAPGHGP
jgi:hypothetical protein